VGQERKISPQIVKWILFGAGEKRRYTQETPILMDVWQQIAARPSARHDLLITPLDSFSAVEVLMQLAEQLPDTTLEAAEAAPLQSFVAIRLTFVEIVGFVLPSTQWARDTAEQFLKRAEDGWSLSGPEAFDQVYDSAAGKAPERAADRRADAAPMLRGRLFDAARVLALIAAIHVAQEADHDIERLEDLRRFRDPIARRMEELAAALLMSMSRRALIWRVTINRQLETATAHSRATVKADAAYRVFDVKCETITWAIVDSGVQHDHPAFMCKPPNCEQAFSRVVSTYNLGILRPLLDVRYKKKPAANPKLAECIGQSGLDPATAERHLVNAYQSFETKILDWSSIEPLLRIAHPQEPADGHGTHVAGILGADWWQEEQSEPDADGQTRTIRTPIVLGMCPDIRLMDLRILGAGLDETEYAVIGALQLVRYLNSHNRHIVVHGVNLSLSIPHEVENYACGRTPVCDECERLVEAGVTVVAAAGNQGYQKFHTEKGLFANYTGFSITDPGNADSVITVGSTHRREPHTYGVSYFSSRGPTGDGRMKPDLVAPGERISSTLPGGESGPLDGTSQATPHVSAAAAMLMARYPELNRNPRRIKRILCDSATELGRERTFEGHGLLDVLRALQSF
jgi:hypothetical protein